MFRQMIHIPKGDDPLAALKRARARKLKLSGKQGFLLGLFLAGAGVAAYYYGLWGMILDLF